MTIHRDGHTLTISLLDMDVTVRVVCPHEGKTFDRLDEHPLCRRQSEDGRPSHYGPYLTDECVVAQLVTEIGGAEAIQLPGSEPFDVTVLPVEIEWLSEAEFWVRPVPPSGPGIVVPAPTFAFKGPQETDVTRARDIADRIEGGVLPGSTSCHTTARLLRDAATAMEARAAQPVTV